MQIASRQIVWNEGGRGTVVEVEMTPATGLYIRFMCNAAEGRPVMVSWGDGSKSEHVFTTHDISSDHRYAAYGRYRIVFEGARSIGLRNLDGEAQYSYDAAIVSYVDYSGLITGSRSGAFKRAVNLERFIAPNLTGFGHEAPRDTLQPRGPALDAMLRKLPRADGRLDRQQDNRPDEAGRHFREHHRRLRREVPVERKPLDSLPLYRRNRPRKRDGHSRVNRKDRR